MKNRDGISKESLGLFYRQLATMVASGSEVNKALQTLEEEGRGTPFFSLAKLALKDIHEKESDPIDFSPYPGLFTALFQKMIQEENREEIAYALNWLADESEKSELLKKRLFKVLFIPTVTMVMALFVITALVVFVVPVFSNLFASMGDSLPLLTQLVISVSSFISNYFWVLVAIGVVKIFFFHSYKTHILSRIPLFASLMKQVAASRFSGFLALLQSVGLSEEDAYAFAAEAMGNPLYCQKLLLHKEKASLAEKVQESGIFTPLMLSMIRSGEKEGSLNQTLREVSKHYEKLSDKRLDIVLGLLEVSVTIAVGLLVGIIVIAMYMPMFQMALSIG